MKWDDEYSVLKKVCQRLEAEFINANNLDPDNAAQKEFARGIYYARTEVFLMMCDVIDKNLYSNKEEKNNED